MSTLVEYLAQKRDALLRRRAALPQAGAGPRSLEARVRAESRIGIRRTRIRDFQILSDSDADFAGYDLGLTSPELQLGVLQKMHHTCLPAPGGNTGCSAR